MIAEQGEAYEKNTVFAKSVFPVAVAAAKVGLARKDVVRIAGKHDNLVDKLRVDDDVEGWSDVRLAQNRVLDRVAVVRGRTHDSHRSHHLEGCDDNNHILLVAVERHRLHQYSFDE